MLRGLDSDGVRVAAYALAVAVVLVTWSRERRRAATDPDAWPAFWIVTASVFAFLAVGRATSLGRWITGIGRSEARAEGWYGRRRHYQALAIGLIGVTGFGILVASLWRARSRWRRYFVAVALEIGLVCFVGARLISLHQIDSLLYRRRFHGAQLGTAIELLLLGLCVVVAAGIGWVRPLVPADAAPPLSDRSRPAAR